MFTAKDEPTDPSRPIVARNRRHGGLIAALLVKAFRPRKLKDAFRSTFVFLYVAAILAAGLISIRPDLSSMILPDRLWLDSHHFVIAMIVLLLGVYALAQTKTAPLSTSLKSVSVGLIGTFLILSIVTGVLMLLKVDALSVEFMYQKRPTMSTTEVMA